MSEERSREHFADDAIPEERESLWILTLAPTIWAAHFLGCYLTGAIWCARLAPADGGLGPVRLLILVYTVMALAGIGAVGRVGFRRHDMGTATVPHDFDTSEDRHRFLGFATLLLAGVSAVATIYVAAVAIFIGSCN